MLKRRTDQPACLDEQALLFAGQAGTQVTANGRCAPLGRASRIERRDNARGTSSRLFALGGGQTPSIPAGNGPAML